MSLGIGPAAGGVIYSFPQNVIQGEKFTVYVQLTVANTPVSLWYLSSQYHSLQKIADSTTNSSGEAYFSNCQIFEIGTFKLYVEYYITGEGLYQIELGDITVRKPTVKVKIIDENENPISDVEVSLFYPKSYASTSKYTDSSGNVIFKVEYGSEIRIDARKEYYDNYPSWTYIAYISSVEGKDYEFTGVLHYTGQPPPPPTYIDVTFIVTDLYTGNPIENAYLNIDGEVYHTDINGKVTVTLEAGRTYDITVEKDEYKSWSGTISTTESLEEVSIKLVPIINVELTIAIDKSSINLGESIIVSGTLTVNGKPYENDINIYELVGSENKLITTVKSVNGEYSVELQPETSGSHTFTASTVIYNTEYWSDIVKVEVSELPAYTVTIKAEETGEVNVYHITGTTEPILKNQSFGVYVNDNYNQTVYTDENGNISFYVKAVGETTVYLASMINNIYVKSNIITLHGISEETRALITDLKINGKSELTLNVKPEDEVQIYIWVMNYGAKGDVTCRIVHPDGYLSGFKTVTLNVKEEYLFERSIYAPSENGTYTYKVQSGHVENGEFKVDDEKTFTLTVISPPPSDKPNPIIVSIQAPGKMTMGEKYMIMVKVKNLGATGKIGGIILDENGNIAGKFIETVDEVKTNEEKWLSWSITTPKLDEEREFNYTIIVGYVE